MSRNRLENLPTTGKFDGGNAKGRQTQPMFK